jgi:hypothetical protein
MKAARPVRSWSDQLDGGRRRSFSVLHAEGNSEHFEQNNRCRHDQHYRHYGNSIADPFPAFVVGAVAGPVFEFFGGFKVLLAKLGKSISIVVVIHADQFTTSAKKMPAGRIQGGQEFDNAVAAGELIIAENC